MIGSRRLEDLANEAWCWEFARWKTLADEASVIWDKNDVDKSIEMMVPILASTLAVFVRIAARQMPVHLAWEVADAMKIEILRRLGWIIGSGQPWGENNCLSDTMLQLLIHAGVLAKDIQLVERQYACAHARLVLCNNVSLTPKAENGVPDYTAFFEHARHADPILRILYAHFANRLGHIALPGAGLVMSIECRLDTPLAPADILHIGVGLTETKGPAIDVKTFNWTGTGASGWHYDPLFLAPVLDPFVSNVEVDQHDGRVIGSEKMDTFQTNVLDGTGPALDMEEEGPRRKGISESWGTYFRMWQKHHLGELYKKTSAEAKWRSMEEAERHIFRRSVEKHFGFSDGKAQSIVESKLSSPANEVSGSTIEPDLKRLCVAEKMSTPHKSEVVVQPLPVDVIAMGGLPPSPAANALARLTESGDVRCLTDFRTNYHDMKPALRGAWAKRVASAQREHSCRWYMYVDVCRLIRLGVLRNASDAENTLRAFAVNRKKVQSVLEHLEGAENLSPPVRFTMVGHKDREMSEARKRDLVRHVELCARSNRPLTGDEIRKCIWKVSLSNKGILRGDGDDVDWDKYQFYEKDMLQVSLHAERLCILLAPELIRKGCINIC